MSSTAVPGPVGRPRGRRLSSVFKRQGIQAFLFISPAVLLLGVLIVYPMVRTSIYSFAKLNSRLEVTRWIGFDNYTRLFMKAIVFVPMAIAATAVAIIWKFVYEPDPSLGSLNAFITTFGADPIAWYGRADTVNYALIFAYVWASTGFAMVVLSAALKGISEEVIEAARTDGANEWDIFRRIQLPLLSLPIAVVTVWLLVNVIKVFDLIYVMTGGGPGGASEVIAVTMVDEFGNGEGGYSAAIAVVMLLLIIPIMVFNIRRFRSERVTG